MKSHTYSLLFFIVIALLPLSILRADECSTLTATGNAEYPPYLWRDPKGGKQLLGANQYVVDEVAKRLGIVIELKDVGSWARAQEALKRGEVDLLAGAFYTDSRRHYMDYIYPAFLNTTSVVWSKPGVSDRYHAREDLIGLKGVTVIDNSFGQEFDEYIKAKLDLTYVPSLKQAFLMLSRDRADYILYEKNPLPPSKGLDAGSVRWSVVQEAPARGQPEEPAIRAEIEIPSRNTVLIMTIKRNADPALTASHLIELIFAVPDDFAGGSINTINRFVRTAGQYLQTDTARLEELAASPSAVVDDAPLMLTGGRQLDSDYRASIIAHVERVPVSDRRRRYQ